MTIPVISVNIAPANYKIVEPQAFYVQTLTVTPYQSQDFPARVLEFGDNLGPLRIDETWTWRQVHMLGQDQLPVGDQVTDLTPKAAPRAPYYGTEWRQVHMLGQDRLPVGDQVTDLTAHRYVAYRLEQTTTWRQVGMLGQDQLPVGDQVTDLTPKAAPRLPLYTWEWRQVGMLGQDQLPVGKQVYDLTGRPYRIEQTWALNLNTTTLAPTAGPLGLLGFSYQSDALPRGPYRPEQTTAWNQIPMLGMDQLPVGEQVTELTPKAPPRLPYYGTEWRQVGMLGQDRLPVGAQVFEDTVHRYVPYRIEQTWTWRQVGMLGQDRLPVGDQVYEDTLHRYAPYRIEQTWVWNQTPMLGQDQLPVGKIVTELPKGPYRLEQTTAWRQVGMLGQDQLPVGEQSTDLTPKAAPRLPYYGTEWRQVGMLGQDRLPVGTQIYDTTTHRYVPYRPEQTTAWRQVGMLGQDQLPIGTQSTDLTPKPAQRLAYYGTEWRQVGMLGQDRLPANQYDWPNPRAPYRLDQTSFSLDLLQTLLVGPPGPLGVLGFGYQFDALARGPFQPDRSFTAPTFIPLIPIPPVVTGLPHNQPFINASMGRMFGR